MIRLVKVLPIFLVLLLCSCEKEIETFEPTYSSTQKTASIAGIVIDEVGEPIAGVEVSYKGKMATTNESGLYHFQSVTVDSKHNTIAIRKDGYFEAARTFRSTKSNELFHQTKLLKKNFNQSFSSSSGGEVDNQDGNATAPTVTISFDPNTIVFDGTQDQYNGVVQVAIKYLDPTDIEVDQEMPGDLSALLADDILGKASTYGMAYVELQSISGERLQIKEGALAELAITIPEELRSLAPDQVTASYFDEGLGLWKEEGKASLQGSNYVSEVTHFSCWSYNSSAPSVIVTARLIDQAGLPLAGMHIQLTEQGGWTGGYGYTDQDGIFTGAVAKDVVLSLYVTMPGYCPSQSNLLLSSEVGPFSIDTDLGDIAVDVSNSVTITVNATFFNCDNLPVTNGIVQVARSYFKITDGTLNVSIPVTDCNIGNLVLWAHDLDTDRLSERFPLVAGVNNFQDIQLCEIEAPFFEFIAPTLGINERSMIEIVAYDFDGEEKYIAGLFNEEVVEEWASVRIDFNDSNQNGFVVGTFPITGATIEIGAFPPVLTYSAAANQGEVTVDIVSSDGLGDYIKGNYRVEFEDVNNGNIHEFTGKFKLY